MDSDKPISDQFNQPDQTTKPEQIQPDSVQPSSLPKTQPSEFHTVPPQVMPYFAPPNAPPTTPNGFFRKFASLLVVLLVGLGVVMFGLRSLVTTPTSNPSVNVSAVAKEPTTVEELAKRPLFKYNKEHPSANKPVGRMSTQEIVEVFNGKKLNSWMLTSESSKINVYEKAVIPMLVEYLDAVQKLDYDRLADVSYKLSVARKKDPELFRKNSAKFNEHANEFLPIVPSAFILHGVDVVVTGDSTLMVNILMSYSVPSQKDAKYVGFNRSYQIQTLYLTRVGSQAKYDYLIVEHKSVKDTDQPALAVDGKLGTLPALLKIEEKARKRYGVSNLKDYPAGYKNPLSKSKNYW